MIAPSCITTSNIFQNPGDTVSGIKLCKTIICPVELTGSHSVTPSTTPKITAFIISKKVLIFPPDTYIVLP